MTVDRDDSVRPLRERRLVHARSVVEAVQERITAQLEQMAEAFDVFSEQHEVMTTVFIACVRLVAAIAMLAFAINRDIGLDAENWLHACGLRLAVKLHGTKHVAVISDGHGIHAEFLHTREQAINRVATVEQRVLGVQMEMREHRFAWLNCSCWLSCCCFTRHHSSSWLSSECRESPTKCGIRTRSRFAEESTREALDARARGRFHGRRPREE